MIAFAPAMRWLWGLNRVRSAFRGITACIVDENCSSIRRFAVDQKGDLQLQDVAIFAEAESHQLHTSDVARFPIRSFDRLFGLIGGGPLHIFAALLGPLLVEFFWLLFLSFPPP